MDYLVLKVKTQTSTFRIPEFQNFHKSFFLPPPTTLMGFAGAALRFTPRDAQAFFLENRISLGIYGESAGSAHDLWKINTFDGKGSVIKREILFFNTFYVLYAAPEQRIIAKLEQAFHYPGFAMTLGASDSLAKIKIIPQWSSVQQNEVEHCLLEGDIIKEVMDNIDNGSQFSIYSSSDPMVYDLPVKFHYEGDFGPRKVTARKQYSFVGPKMVLNVKKSGILVEDHFVPLVNI